MPIPPFPCQDLAKLVLGYLADQQLMTAYDEFLHTSPYLDAQQNEYDRVLMNSLEYILAEYRAVKIYVETCKPSTLRRKLIQCPNLLEKFKFLVCHIDVNNFNACDISSSGAQSSFANKDAKCDLCLSFTRGSYVCKCRPQISNESRDVEQAQTSAELERMVQSTPLANLPGNKKTEKRKKQVKVIEIGETDVPPNINSETQDKPGNHMLEIDGTTNEGRIRKIYNPSITGGNQDTISEVQMVDRRTSLPTDTFHDFSSGVEAKTGAPQVNDSIPNSFTAESFLTKRQSCNDKHQSSNQAQTPSHPPQRSYLLKVAKIKQPGSNARFIRPEYASILPKDDNQRVTILSDVKVDNTKDAMPKVLRNATSTPLMKMRTVMINGTPAFYPETNMMPARSTGFTKDEIMSMPTVILVHADANTVPPIPTSSGSCNSIVTESGTKANRPLGPLKIDIASNQELIVPPSCPEQNPPSAVLPNLSCVTTVTQQSGWVKTADLKTTSAPKDNIATITGKISTPQLPRPLKKSSSTPRRTSHVRVLDFATPRRILHPSDENPAEVLVSSSPNLILPEAGSSTEKKGEPDKNSDDSSVKENSNVNVVPLKRTKNWDEDLRASLLCEPDKEKKPSAKPRCRKKKSEDTESVKSIKKAVESKSKKQERSKTTPKPRKKKANVSQAIEKPTVVVADVIEASLRPTINIINDWNTTTPPDPKSETKSNSKELTDTPEMEKLALQNAIGEKLNISDFLETPYKQVFYDIQMGTPRFLQPDIPCGDPVSEIKITDIPTPKFFNSHNFPTTPKPFQPTPSSYSSRPTDYSSGGSYYKPDDCDYIPELEIAIRNPTITETSEEHESVLVIDEREESNVTKPSRPTRRCTKNVSYNTRSRTSESKVETESLKGSPITITKNVSQLDSSLELEEIKTKPLPSRRRSKNSTPKKARNRSKKESPSKFLRLKPVQPTPTKVHVSRSRRKTSSNSSLAKSNKKKPASGDKTRHSPSNVTPAVTKSRRKSSTPRKVTNVFESDSPSQTSPDCVSLENQTLKPLESDAELALHWSDEASQESKTKDIQDKRRNDSEGDDISRIREYIQDVSKTESVANFASWKGTDNSDTLHLNLVKRGFDIETAQRIERDLLDNPSNTPTNQAVDVTQCLSAQATSPESLITAENKVNESLISVSSNLDLGETYQLSICDCNEDTNNYFVSYHEEAVNSQTEDPVKLDEDFAMEVFLPDENIVVTLRATACTSVLDDFKESERRKELEAAVGSILATPLKVREDSAKAQCIEIFDSTLTSLDTPLKSPSAQDESVTEIVSEKQTVTEKVEAIEKPVKKRKRDNSEDSRSDSKKSKAETGCMPGLQNFDIETVLVKLHGP